MSTCENCGGLGLVSTGSNPQDLNSGNKVTCGVCSGSGQVAGAVDNSEGEKVAPVVPDETAADPKDEAQSSADAGGTGSGEPSEVTPKVGDKCMTDDDQPGTLAQDADGKWVCEPLPPG